MFKKGSLFVWVLLASLLFFSCGGSESAGDGEQASEPGFSIRMVEHGCVKNTINSYSIKNLTSITFMLLKDTEVVYKKTISIYDGTIESSVHLKDIPKEAGLTLTILGYGSNPNLAYWFGKVTDLDFVTTPQTAIDVVLYPTTAFFSENNLSINTACLPQGLLTPRFGHSATLLPDNRILIAGGFTGCNSGKCPATKSVEIIDLESGTVELLSDMVEERGMHEAVLLSDGSVLMIGGVHGFGVRSLVIDDSLPSVADFPSLTYGTMSATMKIERYTPSYPKHNMQQNGIGNEVSNISQEVHSSQPLPFARLQSIIAKTVTTPEQETAGEPRRIMVYLAGGIDTGNTPLTKVYRIEIVDNSLVDGTVSVSEVKELASDSELAAVMPALGMAGDNLLVVGGRSDSAASQATLINSSTGKLSDHPISNDKNIFFSKSVNANDSVYMFGGYESSEGLLPTSRIRRWTSETVQTSEKDLKLWNKQEGTLAFPEIVYNSQNNTFMVMGGAGGSSKEDTNIMHGNRIFQTYDASSLDLKQASNTNFARIMPKGLVIPAGVLGESPVLVITGGTTAFDGSGTVIDAIEFMNL
ncbi:hypothetical protein J5834_04215 [bacterium]|nr:hypothetical protein [bacterium]